MRPSRFGSSAIRRHGSATIVPGRRIPESGTIAVEPARAPRDARSAFPGGFASDSAHLLVLPQRIKTGKSGTPGIPSTKNEIIHRVTGVPGVCLLVCLKNPGTPSEGGDRRMPIGTAIGMIGHLRGYGRCATRFSLIHPGYPRISVGTKGGTANREYPVFLSVSDNYAIRSPEESGQ